MTCIALNEEIVAVTKGVYIDYYDHSTHTIIKVINFNLQEDAVCDIAISSDGKHVAVITSTSKKLIVYNLPAFDEERIYDLPRSASKIRFTADSSKILVADKTGDGLIYSISSEDSGIKLLGHFSMLLNILQSEDGRYIITSDRDEKIKVTCYPNTYSIHTYCLGHKEFVNHLEFLPHNVKYLMSTSGDGTVRCWDYERGTLCYTIDTSLHVNDETLQNEFKKDMLEEGVEVKLLPVVHFTIVKLNYCCSLIALCIIGVKKIYLYTLKSDNNEFVHNLSNILEIEEFPLAIKLHNSLLYVYFGNCEFSVYKITNDNLQISVDFVKKISVFDNMDIANNMSNTQNSIKVLYKRKIDNVQEYQERKRQRLGTTEG